MKPRDFAMLVLLAALWGASFLFMRIGVTAFHPFVLIFLRVSLAGVALLLYAAARKQRPNVLHKWKQYLLLGALNAAIPFCLISSAELHLTASLAAILNATTPLFTALVAFIWTKDPLTVKKAGGVLLGIAGVAVLVGWDPQQGAEHLLLSICFSLLAAVFYALAGVYSAKSFRGEQPLDMAIGQQLAAGVLLIPFAAFTLPTHAPSLGVVLAVLGLAIFCTALGYLLYFALIRNVGAVKTLSVTFLIPVFGIVWGAFFLGESVSGGLLVGLVIILVSVALVANVSLGKRAKSRVSNP